LSNAVKDYLTIKKYSIDRIKLIPNGLPNEFNTKFNPLIFKTYLQLMKVNNNNKVKEM